MHFGTHFVGEQRRATRRGKDDVYEEAGVGVRHSYATPGLWIQVSTLIPQACACGYRLMPATRAEVVDEQTQKLRKRKLRVWASIAARMARSGNRRAMATAPIMVEKMARKLRPLSALRRPGI